MKILRFLSGIFLLLMISTSWALLPPAYLSVPKWKSCVSITQRGSAQFVCLPNAKPYNCPRSSWITLNQKHMVNWCHRM